MIELRERFLWCVVAVVVVGAVGLAVPVVGAAAPAVLAAVVLAAAIDFVLARSPRRVRVARVLPERLWVHHDVVVGVDVSADVDVDVEVVDTLPHCAPQWVVFAAQVAAGETVRARRTVRFARQGQHRAGRIALRTRGPLGLVCRRERRVVDDVVHVGVDLAAVMATAERRVLGQDSSGGRKRRALSRGRELDSLREYRRGDDVRLVDWKASARKDAAGQTLIVKEMVPETRQDVVVVVDAGRQLLGTLARPPGPAAPPGGHDHAPERRFDVAVHTALVLCAAALAKGDRCGVAALEDDLVQFVPPREGRAALKLMADALTAVDVAAVEPAYASLPTLLATRLKRRALVCIVTDVVDEVSARALAAGLAGLRGRHVVVVVALGDPALARMARGDGVTATDALGPLLAPAAGVLVGHRRRALAALEAAGAIVVDAPAARAAAAVVDVYLSVKASGRL